MYVWCVMCDPLPSHITITINADNKYRYNIRILTTLKTETPKFPLYARTSMSI